MHPSVFKYVLVKDAGITGNLEITLGKLGAVDTSSAKKVHTKREGQGYPHSNWEAFHERLDKAMKEAN